MRLAEIPERAAYGTNGEAQQAQPAGQPGVQPVDAPIAPHAFRHAENVPGGDPVAAGHGRVADGKYAVCSFIVKNAAVHCKSAAKRIEYNASAERCAVRRRLNANGIAVAQGWKHAGTSGAEGDGRALPEKRGDDFLVLGHDDGGFSTKKV